MDCQPVTSRLLEYSDCSSKVRDENFKTTQTCKYCRYRLQIFTVTLFHLFAKEDIDALLQQCRSHSHCNITAAKMGLYFSDFD